MAWNADDYGSNATFNWSQPNAQRVLAMLSLQSHEHVFDLGCGSAEFTLAHLAPHCASVLGLDSSQELLAAAQANLDKDTTLSSDHKKGVAFVHGDGHTAAEAAAPESFDVVFSNAALHWMKRDPSAVVKQVFTLLKPGGRFVAEFGGFLNTGGVRAALHRKLKERGIDPAPLDPWFFPTEQEYRGILEAAGYKVELIELQPRPTALPQGLAGWLKTFSVPFLSAVPDESDRQKIIDELCDELKVDLLASDGSWYMMYCRMRFRAVKPE